MTVLSKSVNSVHDNRLPRRFNLSQSSTARALKFPNRDNSVDDWKGTSPAQAVPRNPKVILNPGNSKFSTNLSETAKLTYKLNDIFKPISAARSNKVTAKPFPNFKENRQPERSQFAPSKQPGSSAPSDLPRPAVGLSMDRSSTILRENLNALTFFARETKAGFRSTRSSLSKNPPPNIDPDGYRSTTYRGSTQEEPFQAMFSEKGLLAGRRAEQTKTPLSYLDVNRRNLFSALRINERPALPSFHKSKELGADPSFLGNRIGSIPRNYKGGGPTESVLSYKSVVLREAERARNQHTPATKGRLGLDSRIQGHLAHISSSKTLSTSIFNKTRRLYL